MTVISVITVMIICAVGSALIYGMYIVETDRYKFKKKHGIDPKYHGWIVEEKNDKNQDQ